MKTDNIGILAVQETHYLSTQRIDEINNTHGFRMKIHHNGDQDRPNSKGIAIILNKYKTRWQEATTQSMVGSFS